VHKKSTKRGSGTDWPGPKRAWATKKKKKARKIARKLKKAKRATRRKAFLIGLSLDRRK
jgi:hypothetical protein